jgi:hypothetical protein
MNAAALKIVALFVAVELALVGGIGAILAKRLRFSYARLTPVAYLVYGGAGYCAARVGGSALLAGAVVGLADSATWALFGGLGPQPRPAGLTPSAKLRIVATVTVTALIAGALGGWLANSVSQAA